MQCLAGQQVQASLRSIGTDRTSGVVSAARLTPEQLKFCEITPWIILLWILPEKLLNLSGRYLPHDHTEAARQTIAVSPDHEGCLLQIACSFASPGWNATAGKLWKRRIAWALDKLART